MEVSELVILVTPLLGLKGDLEMTLASRLSTHANVGNMDIPGNKWKICFGNLCLDQVIFVLLISKLITKIFLSTEIRYFHANIVTSNRMRASCRRHSYSDWSSLSKNHGA